MSVRIELDGTHERTLTCLDNVSGKIIMNIPTEETISSVTVKMEGVSRTRLEPVIPEGQPPPRGAKRRAEIEIHRVLYSVQTVFPSAAVREQTGDNKGFTLNPGEYEYPFSLRIPINSSCTPGAGVGGGLLHKLSFENGNIDYAKDSTNHHKGTLPPSLSGIPGDLAWIRYFLKVTVNRTKIYKSNMRQHHPFVFLPIEPPRAPPSTHETFARRKHEFYSMPVSATAKVKGFFNFSKEPSTSPPTSTPMRFALEARLPSPPIVVPNEPLPLRLLITKLQEFKEPIFLRSLQISLLTNTVIRAHTLTKDVPDSTVILSVADLHIPLGGADTPKNAPFAIDPSLWRDRSLPDSVPPSFQTCNISRAYKLAIDIGVSRGQDVHHDVLSLLLPLDVYSGITPPKKLVEHANRMSMMLHPPAAGAPGPMPPLPPRISTLQVPKRVPVPQRSSTEYPAEKTGSVYTYASHSAQASPVGSPVTPTHERPRSSGNYSAQSTNAAAEDPAPPPTYEDAMADDIGPVDGPRREYQQEGGYYTALPDDVR